MSSGRMHPWAGSLVPAVADGLASGFGAAVVEEAGGVEVLGGDEEAGLVAVPEDGADEDPDVGADGGPDAGADDGPDAGADGGPDAGADDGPDAGADVLGWAGKRGASC